MSLKSGVELIMKESSVKDRGKGFSQKNQIYRGNSR